MAGWRRTHVLHAVALVIGLVAFAVLANQLGWQGIRRVLVGTGWWFAVIAAIDLASVLCDAGGVHSFVRTQAPISYARVFAAQASGLAINRLTPGNSLGEPIKITMLMEHVPEAAAISAIVKFNLATIYVALAAIVVGVPLTLLTLDLPGRVELAVWLCTGILVIAAVALAYLVQRGALGLVVRAALRLRLLSASRAARWHDRITSIDSTVRSVRDPASRRALVFVVGSRVLNWTGTIVVLHAAAIPLTAPLVIGMLSVGILITWMSNVIPLGLGLADGGNYALYGALGSSPAAGLDFTMVNRARTCLLAAMGLTIMLIANLIDRQGGDRRRDPD